MRAFVFFSAILAALFAITFKDKLLPHLDSITSRFSNTTITSFKGLPAFPPIEIYGVPKSANMSTSRTIKKAFLAVEQSEGAGARVRRSIGTAQLRNFSPFLMLDHFTIRPGAGFPDHPHR